MSSIISLLFGHSPATRSHLSAGEDQRRESLSSMDTKERSTQLSDDVTLGEFLVETEANTFQQKICAAGYYLTNNQGAESFSRDDIRDALVSAREDLPGNFSRDWTSAMSSNLIAVRPGDAGQFYVPRTGRTAVESQFQELGKRRPARRGTKNDSSSRKENGE